MIRFLLKGLIRDKSRSRLPIIVVAIGVMLSVLMHAYVTGIMGDTIEMSAKFTTGHVNVMTRAYADNIDQMPNDLCMMHVSNFMEGLKKEYPDMLWIPRIKFGGLIDVPDEKGETRSQGSAFGMGIDLLTENSGEIQRLNLEKSIVRGKLPHGSGEVLLSEDFAQKLNVNPGDEVTLISSTMYGEMAFYNFVVSGTVRFGSTALDRGSMVADIIDVQRALDMEDAAGEILGFFKEGFYNDELARSLAKEFNAKYAQDNDEYAPEMLSLRDQENMATFVDLTKYMSTLVTLIFMIAMSLVLWNAGLLGGLRRYGEIGIRLAIGEEKGHVYRTMIYESIMIGMMGTVIGTSFGLFFAWLIQTYGINIATFTKGSSIMMPTVVRARITLVDFYIGFIPGVLSTVVGTMLSGIGIFKRKTAQLFKELEA
jgi:putative ABC transport system permease protein